MRFEKNLAILELRQRHGLINYLAALADFHLPEQRAGVIRMHPNATAALKVIYREWSIRPVDSVGGKAQSHPITTQRIIRDRSAPSS